MTHSLDRISCKQYQQWKSSKRDTYDSRTRGEFMQVLSVMEIKQRSFTQLTFWMRFYKGIVRNIIKQMSCTQLTNWIEFHIGNVSNRNQAEKLHMTHFLNKIKFYTDNVSNENQAKELHTTHSLDVISSRQCQQ